MFLADPFDLWFDAALAGPDVTFAVVAGGREVGSTRYLAYEPDHRRVEIGWTWLAKEAWGTGANSETKVPADEPRVPGVRPPASRVQDARGERALPRRAARHRRPVRGHSTSSSPSASPPTSRVGRIIGPDVKLTHATPFEPAPTARQHPRRRLRQGELKRIMCWDVPLMNNRGDCPASLSVPVPGTVPMTCGYQPPRSRIFFGVVHSRGSSSRGANET